MTIAQKIMEHKGFKARIMEAERLTGEHVHGLPSGAPLDVYPSDVFVEYSEQWMKGPEVFVVPVRANKGLWFDWTMNSKINTAVVPTVKGCNPITGLQTSGIHMERYEDKCPKHGVEFEGNRYCPRCGYKWAPQNYIAGPNTLWIDGFRSEDGSVRQFFFTEDEIRDVATHMIGKENTVPAFGFAFYQPKEMRQEPEIISRSILNITDNWSSWYIHNDSGLSSGDYLYSDSALGSNTYNASPLNNNSFNEVYCCSASTDSGELKTSSLTRSRAKNIKLEPPKEVKEVSIGAGAKIAQDLSLDSYPLDTWRENPSASMVIYFVFQEKLDQMLAKGTKDLTGKKEGMLEGLPIG